MHSTNSLVHRKESRSQVAFWTSAYSFDTKREYLRRWTTTTDVGIYQHHCFTEALVTVTADVKCKSTSTSIPNYVIYVEVGLLSTSSCLLILLFLLQCFYCNVYNFSKIWGKQRGNTRKNLKKLQKRISKGLRK